MKRITFIITLTLVALSLGSCITIEDLRPEYPTEQPDDKPDDKPDNVQRLDIVGTWTYASNCTYGNAGHTGDGYGFNEGEIPGLWWGWGAPEDLLSLGGTAYGDEASGAYMVFTEDGVVTTYDPSGKTIRSGNFEVKNYDPSRASGWEIGTLVTSEPALLFPWSYNRDGAVTEYDLMYFDTCDMTLVYTEGSSAGSWGEITFWRFTVTTLENTGGSDKPSSLKKVSVAEFIDAPESSDVWYELTGEIIGIASDVYGNLDISDGTGEVYIYGLTNGWVGKNDKSFASIGLKVGDIVTIGALRSSYKGVPQGGGPAYYISHIPGDDS